MTDDWKPIKAAEFKAARAWLTALGLTQRELARRTGYAPETINWFLKGMTPPARNGEDRAIKPWVWLRWKRACGDVAAEIGGRKKGEVFGW